MASFYESRCLNSSYVGNFPSFQATCQNSSFNSYLDCYDCCSGCAYDKTMEDKANSPLPWIGLYIAGASLICSLAMAADLFLGFRNKRLWFPCKFFTLNAASLTLLAVAMKLAMDLTTEMTRNSDELAKFTSSVFICMVMGNFMPSLGQMNNNEIILNVTALGILVFTIFINLVIQIFTEVIYFFYLLYLVPMFVMLVLFVLLSSSALYVPSTRKYIDLRYREVHKISSSEEPNVVGKFNVDKLREDVRRYWMMAETSSPQFVIARSVTCVASGGFCVLTAILLFAFEILEIFYSRRGYSPIVEYTSNYKWSTLVIHVIQNIGVGIGTIACAIRLFTTIIWKCTRLRGKRFKAEFRTEKYWIERLVDWKEKPLPLNIRSQKSKRFIHNMKNLFLCFCIRVQIMIVVVSKSIQFFFILIIAPFMLCWHYCKLLKRKFIPKSTALNDNLGSESASGRNKDLSRYGLYLEGENELPERMLKNISDAANRLIRIGKKKQLVNLKELLNKSTCFKGVAGFDSEEILPLDSYEPPNSWMMPVVTLTSIAIALPNIANHLVEVLLKGVNESMVYIDLVEKDLDRKGDLVNIINASKVTWLGVELSRKWLDQDLRIMASKEEHSKGTLESLADRAEKIIMEFKERANKIQKENPLEWPVKAIAANSMYRISKTLLLGNELSNGLSDEELFEKLSVMISDILSACLTNLPRVITTKCFFNVEEKREENIQQAAHLLGETEEILKILQQRELPSLNEDQAACTCIDEWRAIIKQESNLAFSSSSNNDTASSCSNEIPIVDNAASGSSEIHVVVEQVAS